MSGYVCIVWLCTDVVKSVCVIKAEPSRVCVGVCFKMQRTGKVKKHLKTSEHHRVSRAGGSNLYSSKSTNTSLWKYFIPSKGTAFRTLPQ